MSLLEAWTGRVSDSRHKEIALQCRAIGQDALDKFGALSPEELADEFAGNLGSALYHASAASAGRAIACLAVMARRAKP